MHGRGNPGVTFVPFSAGRPSGSHEDFALPAAGAGTGPGAASLRPIGLAEGPDGSLYLAEDGAGRVWRIIYTGGR